MSDLYDALASLFDSLNALTFRIAPNDERGTWIARINFRIGSVQEDIGRVADADAATWTAHRYAGRASTVDPGDGDALDTLLEAIEQFLTNIVN